VQVSHGDVYNETCNTILINTFDVRYSQCTVHLYRFEFMVFNIHYLISL